MVVVVTLDEILAQAAESDVRANVRAISKLRETLDTHIAADYAKFLAEAHAPLIDILQHTPPAFISTAPEQKLRLGVLKIIQKLPHNEVYRPYASDVFLRFIQILRTDNEENAIVCLQTIIDFHRSYKQHLEDHVQSFLDTVQDMYRNMPQAVKDAFDSDGAAIGPATQSSVTATAQGSPMSPASVATESTEMPAKPLLKSMHSFKVLTECPIIVVSFFQSYRTSVNLNLPTMTPLIIDMLALQAAPQAEAHKQAQARGQIFTGVAPAVGNKSLFGEFIHAQVKTMSFLAYILRGNPPALQKFRATIPDYVVRLLMDCPSDMWAARKELLVATRHILSTDFKGAFVSKIDVLLDERVLVSDGVTVHETLRPLAYSMLADLLHNVRSEMTGAQLRRTLRVYADNLRDTSLPPSIQMMCARLLLNFIDRILKMPHPEARQLLMYILNAFADKFASLNKQRATFLHLEQAEMAGIVGKGDVAVDVDEVDPAGMDLQHLRPIRVAATTQSMADFLKDGRLLFKNLVGGLRSLMYGLKNCNPPPANPTASMQDWNEFARGFSAEEVDVLVRLFRETAEGFSFFLPVSDKGGMIRAGEKTSPLEAAPNAMLPTTPEEKEILETFTTVFIYLDSAVFQEVFGAQLPEFFEQVLKNPSLLHVAQFFLANDATSSNFAGLLLRFLVDRLEDLGGLNVARSNIMLRMFKLAFMAVTLFPDANEICLQPHVNHIVVQCLKLSAKAHEPINYFLLLRALFRSIAGGRFELLYKEVLPLLQMLLECLNTLLHAAKKPQERDLYVELCLTVPVRLSGLLPCLSYLMRPLVIALRAGPDLVSQGLRTLELCIDNLTQEFLDPIIAPVIYDLMQALWDHLKPLPHNHQHSHTTLRILGKLGGRNRRFLNEPPKLGFVAHPDASPSVNLQFYGGNGAKAFNIMRFVDVAVRALHNSKTDVEYKQQAFRFLGSAVKLYLRTEEVPMDLAASVQANAEEFIRTIELVGSGNSGQTINETESSMDDEGSTRNSKSVAKRLAQEDNLRTLLHGCFQAAVHDELRADARDLIINICEHIAVTEVPEALEELRLRKQGFLLNPDIDGPYLSNRVLVDAIADSLASDFVAVRELAEEAIVILYESCLTILGSPEKARKLPLFHLLSARFCHSCFKEDHHEKYAGCNGIRILSRRIELGKKWMVERQLDFVRALLFALKDMPSEIASSVLDDAHETLTFIVRTCNQTDGDEDATVKDGRLANLVCLLIVDLSNSNSTVRDAVKSSFKLLAELTGKELHELLAPVRDRLLSPIFTKPLRALPFAMQIGHIDAITFCLSLKPTFLEFNDELLRLLHEALALADAEDEALVTVSETSQYKNATSLVNLRVVCIKLLSKAMACSDFSSPQQAQTRGRIISVFFKSLYSKSNEVVDVANQGLRQVLAQNNKLPKDLLQGGLRPILMNLSDHKRLNVAGLEGLARLLELLTNYFKVEIGRKLLDHLRAWADPQILHQAAARALNEHHAIKIISAILNIFHLLPSPASMFLEELVTIVMDLEEKMRRTQSSPLRAPLLKFLNRYPTEAWAFFSVKLGQVGFSRFFVQLLSAEESAALRSTVMDDTPTLIQRGFGLNQPEDQPATPLVGIRIVQALCRFQSTYITQHIDVINVLLRASKVLATTDEESASVLTTGQGLDALIDTFIFYLKEQEDNLDVFFSLFEVLASKKGLMTHTFEDYILTGIVRNRSTAYRRSVIARCLDLYQKADVPSRLKSTIFQMLANPILIAGYKGPSSEERLLDKDMADMMHLKIWKATLADESLSSDDLLRIELLQMTALLLKYDHVLFAEHRKDIIKFAWNFIKVDDITSKQAAYVLIAYFIAAYETPANIVLQIYVALLRAHQQESRVLVKQALDIIAPVLSLRVPPTPESRYPQWAKWPRRVIAEEASITPQLMIHVYQFLVGHGDVFYEYRDHLMSQLANALSKLGLQSSATPETKILSLDIIDLILRWESRVSMDSADIGEPGGRDGEKTILGKRKLGDAMDVDQSSQSTTQMSSYMSPVLRDRVIEYLLRFICACPDQGSKGPLSTRASKQLESLLSGEFWRDAAIELSVFEKNLVTNDVTEATISGYVNALGALGVVLDHLPDSKILGDLLSLQQLLDKGLRSDTAVIQEHMQPIVARILRAIPKPAEDEDEPSANLEFRAAIVSIIQENVQNLVNLSGAIMLAWTLCQDWPDMLDPLIPGLLKAFQKLAKDHISPPQLPQAPPAAAPTGGVAEQVTVAPTVMDSENIIVSLGRIVDFLRLRISHLGDQRRWFLSALVQLIEKSPNAELCSKILEVVREWVLGKNESFPTVKEKTAVLLKMMTFDSRGDPALVNRFLNLLIDIYQDPTIARTELTVRLEQAFFMGTKADDYTIRNKFMEVFDNSMSRNVFTRLNYILGVQNWEFLANNFWLHQASQVLVGSVIADAPLEFQDGDRCLRPLTALSIWSGSDDMEITANDKLESLIARRRQFIENDTRVQAGDVVVSLAQLQHLEVITGHRLWIELFPLGCSAVSKKDRQELSRSVIALLAKEYHSKQLEKRPNVIRTLLEGIARASPSLPLPPHLVKYLGKSYDSWYVALTLLEEASTTRVSGGDNPVHESTLDALAETYALLCEDDMFYGLWRRRCQYLETNAAISYEQNGMWDKAQHMYETAQIKARTGVLPFSESEYSLWEDHWILCAQKLQQWDILTDLSKHEGYSDLLLECAWRVTDWTADREPLEASIKTLMDTPTPRRYTFEAFMALQKAQLKLEPIQEFSRVCDEGMQLTLRKWHSLPSTVTQAHIPLLQAFQQFVELQEASQIYASLASTHAQNLDSKSQELKGILTTWRERLPNMWDDINAWSDLVAWRQLIFAAINRVYLPLVPALQQQSATGAANSSANSFAYRGYHETAWIINRFAHVARKHQLPEVCINQLTKIYTLPNIEIQEAFLKLREQAKCHYQNPNELNTGLEVISNTNLMYFNTQQKAEFFTLKGMFLAKLRLNDEANQAFATAVQIDLTLAKAWAEWGFYNDRLFKENPRDLNSACNAVSCYLQAAGLYKNGKARKVLSRILWLLSLDDAQGTISRAFDSYKGEVPVWYWTTFIPQLLTSLSHKEARHARQILVKIAKSYPQALHFQLRTTKEDYTVIKRQALAAAAQSASTRTGAGVKPPQPAQAEGQSSASNGTDTTTNTSSAHLAQTPAAPGEVKTENGTGTPRQSAAVKPASPAVASPQVHNRQPWEHVDDIMSILKTAYPLLALSMETMVDQIQQRFKCPPDEDAYRLIVALLNDGVQYIGRLSSPSEDTKLPPATEANISRFAESVLPKHIKSAFEDDFLKEKPNLQSYVAKLRHWRDRFEAVLDRRPHQQNLEQCSTFLTEFQYQKFDEVEVPGQYLLHKDNNNNFVRIDRFLPTLDVVRGHGVCHRRLTIRGHDGSLHPFAVQYPAARHCRREERILQLFRILNGVLSRRKESRRRNLTFNLPVAIPLAPHIRIVQDDPSYVSLQGVYEEYCDRVGLHKDDPLRYFAEKIRAAYDPKQQRADLTSTKLEVLEAIQSKMIPDTVLYEFFKRTFPSFSDFWLFRKQFTAQYASLTFMTYVMCINNRFPHKLFFSRSTGNIWATELLPAMAPNSPVFHNGEAVPFRFTPNIQKFIGPIGIEGIFSCAVMAIARCLTEPEFELDLYLSVFVRDELITWFTQQHRPVAQDAQLREKVATNVDLIVRRASSLSHVAQGNIPANQTIIDLISQAVNPRSLASMDSLFMSWL
ncbi:transcription-associated protein 1 [Saitoella coloradoensis]